ncbi:MAG: uroporphyrinogen-III C-methyltransferase [Dehalococcoidia bacterium]|nr:MAG: uroporphyrinogen-III C-methyltransferase [Dehalococcoidia bacterium]
MGSKGLVYLVGAGPGDPGLITVKGLACLEKADVVVYDRLVSPALLRQAPQECEMIDVGKRPRRHTLPQKEINALLAEKALAGKVVVRLKGGDPFLFGRGGEEAEALAEAGVPFEIVPGVTSAIAAPAYAGIPVTHRDQTSSFAVVTGHEDPTKADSSLDWQKLATGVGTLVILMGVGNLPKIVAKLIEHGRDPHTPVAIVQEGTEARQKTVTGTLADIVEKARGADIKPPAVTVVGEVVALREKLRWFDTKPLFGKRVLVTRSREQASALSERLREMGAEPLEYPAIEIAPPKDMTSLDDAIAKLPTYDWLVFTSANGVRALVDRMSEKGTDIEALARPKIAAIGPATAQALQRYGLRVDYMPQVYLAEEIATGIGDVAGQRILLPRVERASKQLTKALRDKGAAVDEVTAYRTLAVGAPDELKALLEDGQIDIVTFTSSSTVRNLVAGLQGTTPDNVLSRCLVACIGPVTARTAKRLGIRVDVVAREHTIAGLVEAIATAVTERERDDER